MSQEYQYFYEDEVFRIKKGNLELGMVLENAEFVSSDEESDNDEEGKVTTGSIRVAWYPKGDEEVIQERKVGLADRSLMPGDVVRRLIKGKDTQRGYCRQVHMTSSVQVVGTKYVIMDIDSSALCPIEEFSADIAVALDSWVGMVHMSKCDIHMVTEDGSKCILADHEALGLDDVIDLRDRVRMDSEFRRYDFYPGQQLSGLVKVFENAKWLHKTKEIEMTLNKPQRLLRFTVEQVKVVQLGVRWQCRAFSSDSNTDKEQPKYIVQGEDLKRVKMLNIFEPSTLQLGDRNFYVIKEDDCILSKDQWKKIMCHKLMADKNNPLKPRPSKKSQSTPLKEVTESIQSVEVDAGDLEFVKNIYSSDPHECSDADDDSSDCTSVSSAASTSSQGSRNRKAPTLATKILKNRKLKKSKKKSMKDKARTKLKPGDKVVVETLMTSSTADVVWQDGCIETDIPSTVLFPIHHLDDQEFFPGDFVVEQKDSGDLHEYGVIQHVEHAGRTARVKWFRTYTAGSRPKPIFKCEQVVSVYDLRDHPDFRYRPGSVVIRVANFELGSPSAGQVLDNFPTGEVSVWWVDSSRSVCYPQDLYKVGEYDSDENELWDDSASEASWETQSEHSIVAEDVDFETDTNLKTKLVANIEKARISMSRLEEMFTQSPSLQTTMVMKQLLDCYKECRHMDKLLGTTFFQEANFQGMIEKVREKGRASSNQRMAEQFNRLFSSDTERTCDINGTRQEMLKSSANLCENLVSLSMCSTKSKKHHENVKRMSETDMLCDKSPVLLKDSKSCNDFNIARAVLPNSHSEELRTSHMCDNLCSLMKAQLLKTYEEVVARYGGHFDMSFMKECQECDNMNGENVNKSMEDLVNGCNGSLPSSINGETKNNEVFEDLIQKVDETVIDAKNTDDPLKSCIEELDGFEVLESAPDSHKFKLTMFQPTDPPHFYRTVKREMKLLTTSLPPGIWVKGYEDRMDLFSVMIRGPEKTPYEDGLLFFDFQLSADYPRAPPLCHYATYCSDKLNPNLYEDGKVCISLLGTWKGKGTEVWTINSNLLQVIISIQGLILVSEPYFNEAGYERQKGTQQGRENSRMYNEMVVLKLIQAMSKIIQNPPEIFKQEINRHFKLKAQSLVTRMENWLEISENYNTVHPLSPTTPTTFREVCSLEPTKDLPEYPLVPASRGFCLTLRKTLDNFKGVLNTYGLLYSGKSVTANAHVTT